LLRRLLRRRRHPRLHRPLRTRFFSPDSSAELDRSSSKKNSPGPKRTAGRRHRKRQEGMGRSSELVRRRCAKRSSCSTGVSARCSRSSGRRE
jgi:hypothetical protein